MRAFLAFVAFSAPILAAAQITPDGHDVSKLLPLRSLMGVYTSRTPQYVQFGLSNSSVKMVQTEVRFSDYGDFECRVQIERLNNLSVEVHYSDKDKKWQASGPFFDWKISDHVITVDPEESLVEVTGTRPFAKSTLYGFHFRLKKNADQSLDVQFKYFFKDPKRAPILEANLTGLEPKEVRAAPRSKLILPQTALPGSTVKGKLWLIFEPGLHGYAHSATAEGVTPVAVESAVNGVKVVPQYPKGELWETGDGPVAIYQGFVEIPVIVTLPKTPGPCKVALSVHFQQGNDFSVFPPEGLTVDRLVNLQKP